MQKEQIEREKEKNHTTKDQTLLLLPGLHGANQPSYECLLNEKKNTLFCLIRANTEKYILINHSLVCYKSCPK